MPVPGYQKFMCLILEAVQALAGTDRIDRRYLRQFPEFLEFLRGDDEEEKNGAPVKARETIASSSM